MELPQQLKERLYIFLGAPGSGKGTQTLLLADKLRLTRIEMSKLLEERFLNAEPGEYVESEGKKYYVADQQKLWESGVLNETPFVVDTVRARLKRLKREEQSILLDGFPRAISQMEYLMPFALESFGKENIIVLYLDVDEEDTIFRNSHRRICELVRHPILYIKETEQLTLCPLDGSKLITRSFDTPELITTRLATFRKETFPLLEYFEEQGIPVHRISATGSVSEVFSRINTIAQGV
ncbi:MAG: nucleoside monophosphate kinase [bacterium]|nr:nucleoside monophosphate kinase [bacterium]